MGGGFVIVPLLRRFTALTMNGIVATSLLVIAIVGVGGVATALLQGAEMPAAPTLLFTAATAVGMLGGRIASRRLSARQVQLGFAIVLLIVAVGLLAKAVLGADREPQREGGAGAQSVISAYPRSCRLASVVSAATSICTRLSTASGAINSDASA